MKTARKPRKNDPLSGITESEVKHAADDVE